MSGEIKATEEEERKHQENFEKVNPERINRLAKRKELKIKLEAAKLKKSEDEIAELEVRLRHLEVGRRGKGKKHFFCDAEEFGSCCRGLLSLFRGGRGAVFWGVFLR